MLLLDARARIIPTGMIVGDQESSDGGTRMEPGAPQPVLVTGASGFIGRHLVQRMIERGCRVSCLVRATSRVDQLRSAGVQLITGDVTDRGSVERALAESQAD